MSLQAQENDYVRSSWWLGAAGGMNFNKYHGGLPHQLNSGFTVSGGIQSGDGTGYFAFPVIEYHPEDKAWGFMLHAGYDSRIGTFGQDVTTKLAYFTIEPSIRLNLLSTPFYLYAGPRFAVNTDKRFNYKQSDGTMDNVNKLVFSAQLGIGYDLHLTPKSRKDQVILAPFFAFHPYFGQSPRTTDSWNITTLRAGIALKFGQSHQFAEPAQIAVPVTIAVEPENRMLIHGPAKDSVLLSQAQVLSIRKYAFYDLRSSEIAKPYNNLNRKQIKSLKKDLYGLTEIENLPDSTIRQTTTADNFLSILGEQMITEPSSMVTLIGSSEKSAKYGQLMAESMKTFLTRVYGISSNRIKVKGRKKLRIHFGGNRDKSDLALLLEKDRQALIESDSESLQTVFRRGSGAALKPLELKVVHEPNVGGYITIKTDGSEEDFSSWSMKITGENGNVQEFGPYTGKSARLAKKSILGNKTFGEYQISILAQMNSGQIIEKDTSAYVRIWPLANADKYTRFSISYEFNDAKAINAFKKYLTSVVAPDIPSGAKVVIHGHSNIVADRDFDLKLFLSKANDVQDVIQNALAKLGRTNVDFEVFGLGDDQIIKPFEKKKLDPRYYNRTLIIDVIPGKK